MGSFKCRLLKWACLYGGSSSALTFYSAYEWCAQMDGARTWITSPEHLWLESGCGVFFIGTVLPLREQTVSFSALAMLERLHQMLIVHWAENWLRAYLRLDGWIWQLQTFTQMYEAKCFHCSTIEHWGQKLKSITFIRRFYFIFRYLMFFVM